MTQNQARTSDDSAPTVASTRDQNLTGAARYTDLHAAVALGLKPDPATFKRVA